MSAYGLLYRLGLTPWERNEDTGPLAQIVGARPPGRALDAGCGTGRHAVALAEQGWTVTGIDAEPYAVARARERATRAGVADRVSFIVGDVTRLGDVLQPGDLDLVLDLGCFHGLDSRGRAAFAAVVNRRCNPGAVVLLHVVAPRRGMGPRGVDDAEIDSVFGPAWSRATTPSSTDGGGPLRGVPFRWVTLTRAPQNDAEETR